MSDKPYICLLLVPYWKSNCQKKTPTLVFKGGAFRKPNYMTATTASTHRFKSSEVTSQGQHLQPQRARLLPSSCANDAPKRPAAKRLGRSPSPKEREGRMGTSGRNFLQPSVAKQVWSLSSFKVKRQLLRKT